MKEARLLRLITRMALLLATVVVSTACGDALLRSVGERSSDWINEPEVVTTTVPPVTLPKLIDSSKLQWSNDGIVTEHLDDPVALIAEVFDRRQGDRFIQASRAEIAVALPDVRFPASAPYGSAWVSSQLVIENSGLLSDNPSAAFGIWSAEPYTRSRSVAQLVVLNVVIDPETAAQITLGEGDATCARFADRTTDQCQIVEVGGHRVWFLTSSSGNTLIWFDGSYRYEMFGRSFVAEDVLAGMITESVALADLAVSTP